MIDVLDIISDVMRIDSFTQTILMVMVAWSLLLIHIALDSKMYTALFAPGMIIGGLLAFYAARMSGFNLTSFKDVNTILLSLVGIIVGFAATSLMVRGWQAILDLRRPVTNEDGERPLTNPASRMSS